jgi:N-acetylglutamate synthase-like GNAT family acetyltransferase
MTKEESGLPPIFSHVEPVIAVYNIMETISYWQNTLGFPAKWTWGDPPNHGGVSWQKVFIQFSQNPELTNRSNGNSIWIRLQHIESLYEFHQKRNAAIVSPLTAEPWGMTQYTVREINGYYIHFAGITEPREKSETELPDTIKISGRKPTVNEYRQLEYSLGKKQLENESMTAIRLAAAIFAVVAEDTLNNETIGCALLLGDNASYYYIKDVIVHPAWHGKRVGTAMMQELTYWLEKNAANHSLVSLITRETLEPFYQQFGFAQAFSMIRHIHRGE